MPDAIISIQDAIYKIAAYILIYAQTYKTYQLITVHLMRSVMRKYVYRTRTYNVWNVSSDSFCMFSLIFFIILALIFCVVNYFFKTHNIHAYLPLFPTLIHNTHQVTYVTVPQYHNHLPALLSNE